MPSSKINIMEHFYAYIPSKPTKTDIILFKLGDTIRGKQLQIS